MKLRRMFFLTLSFFFILWSLVGFAEDVALRGNFLTPPIAITRLQEIDQQIRELEGMKRGFESRALRHENLAEYLQFDDKANLETRRHLQIAEENRAKA
ncbi:MAG: hypothetical protein V4487_07225, partial [Chlamydiota bacterium]